jgi:hypothetical protein
MTPQADSGGQVIAFISGFPNFGPHATKPREEVVIPGTDNEHVLFRAQDETWKYLGEEMAERGIGVSLFTLSKQLCDLATIGMSTCKS